MSKGIKFSLSILLYSTYLKDTHIYIYLPFQWLL